MNNAEIAHIWAQQKRGSAQGSNFRFEGSTIYSYALPIAKFIEGNRVIILDRATTVTTQKHLSLVRSAVIHLEHYYLDTDIRSLSLNWKDVAPLVYENYVADLKSRIEKLKTARSRIQSSVDDISTLSSVIFRFVKENNLKDHKSLIPIETVIELIRNSSLDTRENVYTALNIHFGIDVRPKLIKEKANLEKRILKEKQELEKRKEKEKENLVKWRNGEYVAASFVTTALRLADRIDSDSGGTIESTHGARVPVIQARTAYRALKAGKDISGLEIGHYTVREVTADTIIIGCHKIPLSEIEAIANQLGWHLTLVTKVA